MPDAIRFREAPADWGAAFAALPAENAPADAWSRVAARLDAPRTRSHRSAWLALAAALVLALAWPWHLHRESAPAASAPAVTASHDAPSHGSTLDRLYTESARLEALVTYARDEQVASGSAAALSARYDARIADIDAALGQPGLSAERQRTLWQARVDTLRALATFEANRRWLATQGERYDGTLARVD
jgi:hypothetical protein